MYLGLFLSVLGTGTYHGLFQWYLHVHMFLCYVHVPNTLNRPELWLYNSLNVVHAGTVG